jgi:hypothetical protein
MGLDLRGLMTTQSSLPVFALSPSPVVVLGDADLVRGVATFGKEEEDAEGVLVTTVIIGALLLVEGISENLVK